MGVEPPQSKYVQVELLLGEVLFRGSPTENITMEMVISRNASRFVTSMVTITHRRFSRISSLSPPHYPFVSERRRYILLFSCRQTVFRK